MKILYGILTVVFWIGIVALSPILIIVFWIRYQKVKESFLKTLGYLDLNT